MKGFDKKNRPETFRIGAPVELHEEQNQGEAFESMLNSVNMCIQSLGYEPENICLIAPRKSLLELTQFTLEQKLLNMPLMKFMMRLLLDLLFQR